MNFTVKVTLEAASVSRTWRRAGMVSDVQSFRDEWDRAGEGR
jgi:hypothetical protein